MIATNCDPTEVLPRFLSSEDACWSDLTLLDRPSIERYYESEARNVLGPLLRCRFRDPTSFAAESSTKFLVRKAWLRLRACAAFLVEAAKALHEIEGVPARGGGGPTRPISFQCLTDDTHNGARRPLRYSSARGDAVLKFADPRPFALLSSVLAHIESLLSFSLNAPPIECDIDSAWYRVPFIEEDNDATAADIPDFMYAYGTVTATAYCLGMVDVHLENVVVSAGRPVIVDPECMLYCFDDAAPNERLISTGLLAHSMRLSALRGGEAARAFGPNVDEASVLRYHHKPKALRNRLRLADGSHADAALHKAFVLQGFNAAYETFSKHKRDFH
jgi:hypothetical protein